MEREKPITVGNVHTHTHTHNYVYEKNNKEEVEEIVKLQPLNSMY